MLHICAKLYYMYIKAFQDMEGIVPPQVLQSPKKPSTNRVNVIESMYNSPKASIFTDGMYSEPFETRIGVKQGDVLSTLLFNIFVNDIPHEISKQSKYSIHLFNTPINSLLFADDLVIFALTKEGLQEKINKMEQFCQKWGLEVNISKTKIMIFNKPGATIKK